MLRITKTGLTVLSESIFILPVQFFFFQNKKKNNVLVFYLNFMKIFYRKPFGFTHSCN